MFRICLKMLFNDRAKFFGILMGVMLASLVITQQGSIFVGIMHRACSIISDMPAAEIWVMDPKVQYIEDQKPMTATQLPRVRGVEGIEWAMPFYKGQIRARLDNGQVINCVLLGYDDATLVGGPGEMAQGKLENLRGADAVIVDEVAATGRLAKPPTTPGGQPTPLQIGDTLELNDNRAVVVGIARMTRSFQNLPAIVTTYSRATTMAPRERRNLSYILVKPAPGVDKAELCRRITETTGLAAYTSLEFRWMTVNYFLKYTGIPINFGLAVGLGFLVGTVITGFMFYNFTLDNFRYFATFKAMGASDVRLMLMLLLQAVTVGLLGFGLGVGLTGLFGISTQNAPIAFFLTWQLLVVAGCAIIIICMLSAMLAIRKVIRLEPGVVFKGA
jgi:putative ABC transport system permease protein